jgi:hypothetical protein
MNMNRHGVFSITIFRIKIFKYIWSILNPLLQLIFPPHLLLLNLLLQLVFVLEVPKLLRMHLLFFGLLIHLRILVENTSLGIRFW